MTCICWEDIIISTVISLVLVLLTYAFLYSMKPRLKIRTAGIEKSGNHIRIEVVNSGRFDAVNVRIEACAYDAGNSHTYHFKLDHPDFLILPGRRSNDNTKTFKTLELSDSAIPYGYTYEQLIAIIQSNKFRLRIRLHSYHAFSGFGKAREWMENIG